MRERLRRALTSHPLVPAGVAALLLALAALLIPRRVRPHGDEVTGTVLVPDPPAFAAFLVVVLAFSLVVLYIVSRSQRPRKPPTELGPRKKNRWAQVVGIIVMLALLLLSRPLREAIERLFAGDAGDSGAVLPRPPGSTEPLPPGTEDSAFLGMMLTLTLLVLVLGTLYLIYALSRREVWMAGKGPGPRALDAALKLGIEDLEHIREPRSAVIASYSRLQDLSDHVGVRRDSDTPYELLDRLVKDTKVPRADIDSLTNLFERAKFSTHEIDESMRSEALRALKEVRRRLISDE